MEMITETHALSPEELQQFNEIKYLFTQELSEGILQTFYEFSEKFNIPPKDLFFVLSESIADLNHPRNRAQLKAHLFPEMSSRNR